MKSAEEKSPENPDHKSVGAFGPVAVFLHWFIAGCIVLSVAFGLISGYADTAEVTRATLEIHQSIGVTIFLLALARLLWRLTHRAPPLPETMPRGQKIAAALTHGTLYLILFALPVTGYVGLAARGRPITIFGLFDLPNVVTRSLKLSAAYQNVHNNLQFFLYALLVLHVGAALYHQFVIKDGLLRRMWPRRTAPAVNAGQAPL